MSAVSVRKMETKFGFNQLHKSYIKCRKNKRNTINALKFEQNLEANLLELESELKSKTYKPKHSVCFTVIKPKSREIFAADFRDRIVHHIVVDHLEKIFEPKFIFDSYACRKNKGTHKAVERLQKFMRKATLNNKKRAYYLQLDLHNFFMSIDKNILFSMIKKHVKDKEILWLTKIVIFNNPTKNFMQKSSNTEAGKVPEHKSLFNAPVDTGLAIGNYTSQFFANIYLNQLDQFVKHKLKYKFYVRYVDDFVLLASSKKELHEHKEKIEQFIDEKLSLKLNPKQTLLPISNGANFLGYIIKPYYRLVRKRVVNNFLKKLEHYKKKLVSQHKQYRQIGYGNIAELQAVVNSYLGHFRHANTHTLEAGLLEKYSFLRNYFIFTGNKAVLRFNQKYPLLKKQYNYFAERLNGFVIIIQIGCFYQILSAQAKKLSKLLNLKLIYKRNSWWKLKIGFHIHKFSKYTVKLLYHGFSLAIIKQVKHGYVCFRILDKVYVCSKTQANSQSYE